MVSQANAARSAGPGRVALVGNAPACVGWAEHIDAAATVVRFNNAPGFGERTGRRVTHLALVNHGGQMREWLDDPGFTARPHVAAAERFLLPFERRLGDQSGIGADGRDWTTQALARLLPLDRPVELLPNWVRREARRRLGTDETGRPAPSTGFLVAIHLAATLPPNAALDCYGFGFAGWDGHDFAAERRWFEKQERDGRLRLHPLRAPGGTGR